MICQAVPIISFENGVGPRQGKLFQVVEAVYQERQIADEQYESLKQMSRDLKIIQLTPIKLY